MNPNPSSGPNPPKPSLRKPSDPLNLFNKSVHYRVSQKDCWACPSRSQCCSSNKRYGRSIVVTAEAAAMRAFRMMQGTPELRQRMGERARVAEFVHAWLKAKLGLRRFHVRGLTKVGTEALWAALTYNVQQWIRLRWQPRLAMGWGLRH